MSNPMNEELKKWQLKVMKGTKYITEDLEPKLEETKQSLAKQVAELKKEIKDLNEAKDRVKFLKNIIKEPVIREEHGGRRWPGRSSRRRRRKSRRKSKRRKSKKKKRRRKRKRTKKRRRKRRR